jgi:hypothetical protein
MHIDLPPRFSAQLACRRANLVVPGYEVPRGDGAVAALNLDWWLYPLEYRWPLDVLSRNAFPPSWDSCSVHPGRRTRNS